VTALLTALHVIICIVLILAVLLQSGKAADLAGAFGGGGSATAFGPRGQASLMSKVTTISAVLFMFTSLGLWILSGHEGKSAMSGVKAPAQTNEAPMTPAAKPPAPKTDANAVAPQTPADKTAVKPPADKTAAPATNTPSSGQPAPQPAPKK
jgi:preprotein translocase subunit SecG